MKVPKNHIPTIGQAAARPVSDRVEELAKAVQVESTVRLNVEVPASLHMDVKLKLLMDKQKGIGSGQLKDLILDYLREYTRK